MGTKERPVAEGNGDGGRRSSPSKKETTDTAVVASLLRPTAKRPSSVTDEILNGTPVNPPEKKAKTIAEKEEKEERMIPRTVSEDGDEYDGEIVDYEDEDDDNDENRLKIVDESEVHGVSPLHKRCVHCNMVMLKKNLSRHIRDQHTEERPRSQCPICQKSYKTPDWLKDHIRRGHGYTKEATDSLMDKLKLKPVNPHRLKNNNTAAISAN